MSRGADHMDDEFSVGTIHRCCVCTTFAKNRDINFSDSFSSARQALVYQPGATKEQWYNTVKNAEYQHGSHCWDSSQTFMVDLVCTTDLQEKAPNVLQKLLDIEKGEYSIAPQFVILL